MKSIGAGGVIFGDADYLRRLVKNRALRQIVRQ